MNKVFKWAFLLLLLLFYQHVFAGLTKGIYITQSTAEDTRFFKYLIGKSKATGITTFIVDLERPSKRYRDNVALLKENNITYVARIIMFPDGGTHGQIMSKAIWEKKYALAQQAINWGATQIQLDYIRYNTAQGASSEHAKNILRILQWFKSKLAAQNIPLQIDVFGITSFGEEKHIGQSITLFSQSIDALCPMLYPSHFEPYREHAKKPYETVYKSIERIRAQFEGKKTPFKMYPYIELYNYRYALSHEQKLNYIYAQIQAAENSGANGWYVWNPFNDYENLFHVLRTHKVQ